MHFKNQYFQSAFKLFIPGIPVYKCHMTGRFWFDQNAIILAKKKPRFIFLFKNNLKRILMTPSQWVEIRHSFRSCSIEWGWDGARSGCHINRIYTNRVLSLLQLLKLICFQTSESDFQSTRSLIEKAIECNQPLFTCLV